MTRTHLRQGDYREALKDVQGVDLVCADPPYSKRTHSGHDSGTQTSNAARAGGWTRSNGKVDGFRPRRDLSYTAWGEEELEEFTSFWAPRNRGWFVVLSDSDLCLAWRTAFERHGLTGFQPIPICIPGMTVRLCGDGPSSWAIYANVARPKALHKWGTLPGFYTGPQGERVHIGGKPLWAMRALIRDYSKPGDVVCDPCAGSGTTLLAAAIEGRKAIGSEVDPKAYAIGKERLAVGYTPSFDFGEAAP